MTGAVTLLTEVLWGRVEGLTPEVKNIKGFGHLKRTAVERR